MAEDQEARQQDLARLMIRKARQDLALVENLVESTVIADEIFGFHVQQAIEKALKATLTRFGRPYAFTHDLSILYEEVEDLGIELPATLEQVERMTTFAVQFRYALFEEGSLNRQDSAKLASAFVAWSHTWVEKSVE